MGKTKAFADGGGLCSPGRWPPGKRNLPAGPFTELREAIGKIHKDSVTDEKGRKCDSLGFVLRLAAGRFAECLFLGVLHVQGA